MAMSSWSRFLKVAVLADVAVVELSDVLLSVSYAPWLFALVQEMPGLQIHLDCDDVKNFSSETLATLLLLQKKAKENGGRVRLFNVGQEQYEVLAGTKVTKVIDAQVRQPE